MQIFFTSTPAPRPPSARSSPARSALALRSHRPRAKLPNPQRVSAPKPSPTRQRGAVLCKSSAFVPARSSPTRSALALQSQRPPSARSCPVQKLGFCSRAKLPRPQRASAPKPSPPRQPTYPLGRRPYTSINPAAAAQL
jgi:hypothetical protein